MPDQHVKLVAMASLEQDLMAPPMIFPGEDPAMYEGLREALLHDLAPRSAYERLLAENMVTLEWEGFRHRRMRDDLIRVRTRDLAIGTFESGKPRSVHRASEEATALGRALVGPDRERAVAAATVLKDKHKISPGEIVSQACNEIFDEVEVHEKKISDLEKRRQRSKEEYDRLRTVPRPPVADAEIVG